MATSRAPRRSFVPNSPFNAGRDAERVPVVPIPVGEQVSHDRHGLGRVVALDGESAVIVDFGHGEYRRVDLTSKRLERL